MVDFKIFSSKVSPRQLFEFRYGVYVREMGRPQRYADHDAKTIIDPLDENGINVIAFDQGEIVGCVRTNFLREGAAGDYEEFYRLNALTGAQRRSTSICTRLMIEPSRRRTFTTFGVMRAVYEFGLQNGIDANYIDCNEHLVDFFLKFGYVLLERRMHAEYGAVSILRLDLLDEARLTATRSPFLPSLQTHLSQANLSSTKGGAGGVETMLAAE